MFLSCNCNSIVNLCYKSPALKSVNKYRESKIKSQFHSREFAILPSVREYSNLILLNVLKCDGGWTQREQDQHWLLHQAAFHRRNATSYSTIRTHSCTHHHVCLPKVNNYFLIFNGSTRSQFTLQQPWGVLKSK